MIWGTKSIDSFPKNTKGSFYMHKHMLAHLHACLQHIQIAHTKKKTRTHTKLRMLLTTYFKSQLLDIYTITVTELLRNFSHLTLTKV